MHNMYAHNCNKVLLHLQFNVTHCEWNAEISSNRLHV